MAAPTVYRSDDASAPVLTGEVGKLIALLDAILVTGYGAKAAAGWTKPYTGTNYAAFRQGSGLQHYFQVNDTGAQLSRIVGYRSMSDVLTGTNPFPTEAQLSGGVYCRKSITANTTARPWICYATDQAFYLFVLGGSAAITAYGGGDAHLGFGQLLEPSVSADANASFLIGCTDTSTTSTTATTTRQPLLAYSTAVSAGHYCPGPYTQAESSTQFFKRAVSYYSQAAAGSSSGVVYPDPATGGLHVNDIVALEAGYVRRGRLPGLMNLGHTYNSAGIVHLNTFSGNAGMSGRNFQIVLTGVGGLVLETNGGW